ncbi:tyrosine protein phosphatase [Mesobacillus foraminis]|uniref:tyrosine-protein phosphatase n=1 Tax=Mesobacillus foraminis TaxID=279826 RepID=UPI001BE952CC|nr:CpsB/CapC family capsule biosynthesis tyrosine phosphatase [Mesobacillus foraminis]MBT2756705.1 tyrosine protein phosphatase [Mesobacillus foraminis]
MIDIHCHILPGLDDGAQHIDNSIDMVKLAKKEGINTIIATPHHKNGRYENTKHVIIRKVDELNERLQKENIKLTILPGQEPAINGELLEDYQKGEVLSLNNTQYQFIELPSNHVPRYTTQLLFDLQLRGLTPIIVHPERNQEIQERPELLYNMIEKGALAQLTAGAVCGKFGKRVKNLSFDLIEANLVHFIASDAHNIYKRSFNMGQAFDVIGSKYGIDMLSLFQENAELVIEGKNVYREAPQQIKKKKFLGIF